MTLQLFSLTRIIAVWAKLFSFQSWLARALWYYHFNSHGHSANSIWSAKFYCLVTIRFLKTPSCGSLLLPLVASWLLRINGCVGPVESCLPKYLNYQVYVWWYLSFNAEEIISSFVHGLTKHFSIWWRIIVSKKPAPFWPKTKILPSQFLAISLPGDC